jgi:hypothetical protein
MISASAILVDKLNKNAREVLAKWNLEIKDDRKLLDPIWVWKLLHRHDQSILSCLVAANKIDISYFLPGIFQTGLDNSGLTPESSWLIHGNLDLGSELNPSRKYSKFVSNSFHKYELIRYLLIKYLNNICVKFFFWRPQV